MKQPAVTCEYIHISSQSFNFDLEGGVTPSLEVRPLRDLTEDDIYTGTWFAFVFLLAATSLADIFWVGVYRRIWVIHVQAHFAFFTTTLISWLHSRKQKYSCGWNRSRMHERMRIWTRGRGRGREGGVVFPMVKFHAKRILWKWQQGFMTRWLCCSLSVVVSAEFPAAAPTSISTCSHHRKRHRFGQLCGLRGMATISISSPPSCFFFLFEYTS